MSRTKVPFLCAALITLCLPIFLQAQEAVPLPVRKVELYKNGMGFFEHLGAVKGAQSVEIVLPSSQLNDVLKSLTVLDLGGGQIAAVNYDSAAPLDRRLSELPINLNNTAGLITFLNQIRGAGIEIRTPAGLVSGKLMGAEMKTKSTGPGITVQEIVLSIFAADGQIRLIELESAGAFKLTDQALAADLGRYLGILDTTHQRDVRKLRIQTLGSGERQLYIGYTSETPIWKTSYRIVLDPKQKPLLQGWAIVDNTTPMDWLDVSLSLVAGAPISFIQDLAQPLYAQRPVVPVAQGIQAKPQSYEATSEEDAADMNKSSLELMETMGGVAGNIPSRSKALRMESFAAPAATPPPMPAALSDTIRRQVTAAAQAQAVGEQFEYKLRQPVTIRRNESALLPILQSDVDGEKVSIFRSADNEPNPRLAFWLKNASGLTLDAGPVTVIDGNAFAGEGLIETVQPGENRLLSYAIDLGTTISTNSGSERKRVERVIIQQGMMRMLAKTVEKKTYKIRNNNETARSVVLEHPVRAGWKLIGSAPAETSASYYRFKVEAKPKSTVEYVVQEESPLESAFALSSITPEQIAIWIRDKSIDSEIEKMLQGIAQKQVEMNDLAGKIAAADKEQNDIFKDQERVRGNLQRLNQTPDEAALRLRYIRQLDGQENRLAAIRTEREKLETSRAAAQKQLEALVEKLSIDKTL